MVMFQPEILLVHCQNFSIKILKLSGVYGTLRISFDVAITGFFDLTVNIRDFLTDFLHTQGGTNLRQN